MTVDPLPDWVANIPAYDGIKRQGDTQFERPFTVQQLLEFGRELIEQFLRRVVSAVVGVFVPGAGPAFDQLRAWSEGLFGDITAKINDAAGINLSSWDAFLGSLDDGKGIDITLVPKLVAALDGIPWESGDPGAILQAILEAAGNVLGGLRGLVPIGLLTDRKAQLIFEGGFDGPATIVEGSGWEHDDSDGVPGSSPVGCARLDCDGAAHIMASEHIEVAPGWELSGRFRAKWESFTSTGDYPIRVEVWPFHKPEDSDVYSPVGSPVMLAGVESPSGASGGPGGWGADPHGGPVWVVPGDGTVTHIVVRPKATEDATSGVVKLDNVIVEAIQKIPQRFTKDLPEDLSSLFNHIELWVDSALDALNIPKVGSLADRILDLSDEMEWLQARGQDVQQLLDDLLTNPASVLGNIPQSLVAGLSGAVSELTQIRDILRGDAITPTNQAIQDIKDWWTGVQGRTQHLTSGGLLDHSRVVGLQSQITTGVDGLAEAVRDGAAAAAGTFTGIVDEAYQGLLDLFGLANTARDIAITAQSQIQEITNDTEAPPGLDGISWSATFGGDLNSALPSGDWPSVYNLVIKDGGHLGIADAAPNTSIAWAVTAQAYATEGMSASVVLGPPRGKTGWDTLYSGAYVNCNPDFTSGAYTHIRPDRINFGRMQRSGTTFTFTQLATVSGTFKQGDLVRIRHYSGTYHVVVNGLTKLSFTDASSTIPRGAGYDRAGISQQRGQFSDFFGSWTNDSWRMAGFAMSDWLPAGVNVETASWRLRRGAGGEVALSVGHGAQAAMPSGFYTMNDLASKVTISDLGTGTVTVTEDGWYEIMATSTNRDNFNEVPSNLASGTYEAGDNRASWRSTLWVLFVDGTPVAGPIMAGVSTTVYLAAGQQIRPGVSASWPLVGAGGHATDAVRYFAYSGRSAITHVSGAPSASFTGRKVG